MNAQAASDRLGDVRKQPDLSNWFYQPIWQRMPALKLLAPADIAGRARRWLVFADCEGLGRAIVQCLVQADVPAVMVVVGERFEQIDDRLYMLDPQRPEDYAALLGALPEPPDQILHLWSVDADRCVPEGIAGFEAAQVRGFYSLIFLVQALDAHGGTPIHLNVVTSRAHSITADVPAEPARTTAWGLCRVISQEYPQISSRCVDVSLPAGESALLRLSCQLLTELLSDSDDLGVAYRGRQRWVQRFEPLHLAEAAAATTALRQRGVYLVTGGLAEIGLALSSYLAHALQARLILVEGSHFPERAEWEDWLGRYSEHDHISRKIRRAADLERLGAEVLVISGDLSSAEQMSRAIECARARFGVLHGVIHAAAVTGEKAFRSIRETDRAACGWHFGPKAHGLIALEHALRDQELDFCLLVSSLAAFLGGRGYAAYAAANSFMDAFAQAHNRAGGTPWVSVNWDAWQLEDGRMTAMSQELALLAMTPAEGGEALRRIVVADGLDQVVVSTADIGARIARGQERARTLRGLGAPELAGTAILHPRPALSTPYAPPETELERAIAAIWQNALGFEQIGIHDNFFDLGADSLIAIHIVARLKEALGAEISAVSLYENLTIKALAQAIVQDDQTDQGARDWEAREARISRRKHYRQIKLSERESEERT